MLDVFEFGAGAAAVIVMTCALYGWGRMTRNLVSLPDGTWPVSTALGMASVIFLGGLLNFARMAFPIVLAALIFVGLILALHAILRDENALQKFRTCRPQAWHFAWAISALLLTGLAIATQLAPEHYNSGDDFQHFFGHAIRMVHTGTLYGSPLNALGGEVLGAQAFLQTFIVGYFPIKFINGADAVFCFFLCLALAGGVGFSRPLLAPAALLGAAAVFIIDPQYVNISSLFSTAVMIGALMIITADAREGGETVTSSWRQTAAPALFCASAIALKNTGIVFVGLWLAVSAAASFQKSDWRIGFTRTVKIAVWTFAFVVPWVLLYFPYYIAGLLQPVAAPLTPVPGVRGLLNPVLLISPANTFYGASRLAYTFLAGALLLCAVDAALAARNETEHRSKALTALATGCAAAAGTYLFWMIIGPRLQESETTLRYPIPVLIGASAVAVPLWAALTGHRSRIINLGLASVLILLFASPMRDRLSTFYHQKSGLAYLHQWGGTEIAQNQQFMRPVLLDKDPLNIRAFQETVPAGEPLLVWVGTPFVLDYTRNEILDMNIAGLGQAWGRISIPRYVLWQRSGYGIATPEDYRYEIRAFRRRSGQLAARALDVVLWLQTIAPQSKILREENGVVLFQTSEDTLAPPG